MSSALEGVERQQAERRHQLLKLKRELVYDGPDWERYAASVAMLAVLIGYTVTDAHYKLIVNQAKAWCSGRGRSLNLAFRGLGKTSVGLVTHALKRVLVDPNVRMLFVSDSESAAKEFLKEVVAHLQTNDLLIEMFGQFFPEGNAKGSVGKQREGYATVLQRTTITLREPTFLALGVRSQMASRHFEWIFADDLVTHANSQTARQRHNLRQWHNSTLLGATLTHTMICYNGTRYYPGDLYDEFEFGEQDETEGPLADVTVRIPMILNYDDPMDEWVSCEPERFPLKACIKKAREYGRYHFKAQMQQDTSEGLGEVFSYADFRWYGGPTADVPLPPVESLVRWQASDMAALRTETGDFYATVTIGVEEKNGIVRIFVLDLVRKRAGTLEQKNSILACIRQYAPIQHGVEAVQAQAGFAQELKEGTMLPITPITRGAGEGDKVMRARRVSPCVEAHQVYFPQVGTEQYERVKPLISELAGFPNAVEHDDCVDAFVDAITLAMFGGPEAAMVGDPDEADDEGLMGYEDEDDEEWP